MSFEIIKFSEEFIFYKKLDLLRATLSFTTFNEIKKILDDPRFQLLFK